MTLSRIEPIEPIETGRLSLLPLAVEHAEEMAEVLSDPALHHFTGGEPLGPRPLRTRYERLVAGSPDPAVTWWNWVIHLRCEGRRVGTAQATVTTGEDPHTEVAWVVGTPWQGRGIATEAARGLVDWLACRGLGPVRAHIAPGHHASARVASAVGLAPTRHRQDGEVRWEGRPDAR
ncbi:GNAT family N-acetyltransferase [Streptomyces sp. NPDC005438]|uniref:GNAT family N-acetyltransferase n=1 Tax=Streptomyces sp. NPDC005438 TaxID=3156880 RepID=UPI0033AC3076